MRRLMNLDVIPQRLLVKDGRTSRGWLSHTLKMDPLRHSRGGQTLKEGCSRERFTNLLRMVRYDRYIGRLWLLRPMADVCRSPKYVNRGADINEPRPRVYVPPSV